ncbi:N-acetylmuramoyl-L-alanine amidase [Sinanaerobacter chloroacetimidivorans]|jgi:N-acetylmuramoyl-L-alanine amidase|uniref:N-acetylmuramoyl-L-alanine amidase n=1 Tax=Sinanaerobacter chloroacetimidivorans TaxID=2818044 RepID=A0A8J7W2L7_9FIRM|nr:N-acetylmuramoyl-L-alanine amidase [Sinanaerobacter chloroacetimidivorans]MBR0597976.1 N-acetylmuramoyl-L-alanine amidase [Sinanaerobacter chloroacetimidivorans]
MKIKINKKKIKWQIAVVILFVAMAITIFPTYDNILARVQKLTSADVLLIDPGHGGMDGGAESAAGVTEKNINLAIALHIKELAERDGWNVVMTREEDKGLYNEDEKRTIRSKKTEDLLARKKMIEEAQPLAAVSIHLNSFKQDRSVRGAQTFYPTGGDDVIVEESKKLAEAIQEQLIIGINDGTERTALGKRDVLLFKNPAAPIVIVECGFLSNPEESKLLENKDYQRKLAQSIYDGIMKYSGKEAHNPILTIDSRG